MSVRPYQPTDRTEWHRMRRALWEDPAPGEMDAFLAQPNAVVLVAERPGGGLCGFAEVAARSAADGCSTTPVAYLEGWYVDADARRRGVGAALIAAVEGWARGRGYRELASDTELDNEPSQRAHERVGFAEVGRVVQFVKGLKTERRREAAERRLDGR